MVQASFQSGELADREGALEMIERIELFQPAYPGLVELKQKLES